MTIQTTDQCRVLVIYDGYIDPSGPQLLRKLLPLVHTVARKPILLSEDHMEMTKKSMVQNLEAQLPRMKREFDKLKEEGGALSRLWFWIRSWFPSDDYKSQQKAKQLALLDKRGEVQNYEATIDLLKMLPKKVAFKAIGLPGRERCEVLSSKCKSKTETNWIRGIQKACMKHDLVMFFMSYGHDNVVRSLKSDGYHVKAFIIEGNHTVTRGELLTGETADLSQFSHSVVIPPNNNNKDLGTFLTATIPLDGHDKNLVAYRESDVFKAYELLMCALNMGLCVYHVLQSVKGQDREAVGSGSDLRPSLHTQGKSQATDASDNHQVDIAFDAAPELAGVLMNESSDVV